MSKFPVGTLVRVKQSYHPAFHPTGLDIRGKKGRVHEDDGDGLPLIRFPMKHPAFHRGAGDRLDGNRGWYIGEEYLEEV